LTRRRLRVVRRRPSGSENRREVGWLDLLRDIGQLLLATAALVDALRRVHDDLRQLGRTSPSEDE